MIAFLSTAALASGATMTVTGSQTETLTDNWYYTVSINNGGNVRGPGIFYDTATGDSAFDVILSLPSGSAIDSAYLDLDAPAPTLSAATALSSWTGNFDTSYVPVSHAPTGSVAFLTISGGGISHTVSGSSISDLDLLALGFGPALLAGDIQVQWRQTLTLTFDDTNWTRNQAYGNSTGTYLVAGSATTTAWAALTIDYSERQLATPEANTSWLLGGAATALALLELRRRLCSRAMA